MSPSRPSRRHANVIRGRARFGYDEDQLARLIGVTREVMHKWAKYDKDFALALDEARRASRTFWLRIGEEVRERDAYEAAKFRKAPDDQLLAAAKAERNRKAPNSVAEGRPSSTE
jgi:hypothetical protein